MSVVIDAHVHIYPHYDLTRALHNAEQNLLLLYQQARKKNSRLEQEPSDLCIALTERFDCFFYRDLIQGKTTLPQGTTLLPRREAGIASLLLPSGRHLHIIAGRQIVTCERLELLCFGADAHITDGLSFTEAQQAVRDAGGLPVLNWAPGKWLFKRKPIVEKIIAEATPGEFLLCDTTLRPRLWAEPILMRRGRRRGLGVLAGSDPLPLPGEELRIGSYGLCIDRTLRPGAELASLKELLHQPKPPLHWVGRRSSLIDAGWRIFRHMRSGQ